MLFFAVMLLLAFVVGLRPDDVDCDYSNYLAMYNNDTDITTEISFVLIAGLVRHLFDNVTIMFLFYALLSLSLKSFAIRKLTNLYFLTVLVFFSTSYILHDFNQIRAGVATGFMLLGIPYLRTGKRLYFLLFALLATLFHYSACILLFLVFLDYCPFKRYQYWLYGSIIPICYLFYFLHINVFYMVPIPYFEEKMEVYEELQHTVEAYEVNVFNLLILTKIIIAYFLLYFAPVIEKENKYFPALLKIDLLALGAFVLFTEVPIISFRINELLGVTEIILYPLIYYAFKPRWLSSLIVILMSFVLLMIYLFYNHYLYL